MLLQPCPGHVPLADLVGPTEFGLPEWIRMLKAWLVSRYEISDLFQLLVVPGVQLVAK